MKTSNLYLNINTGKIMRCFSDKAVIKTSKGVLTSLKLKHDHEVSKFINLNLTNKE